MYIISFKIKIYFWIIGLLPSSLFLLSSSSLFFYVLLFSLSLSHSSCALEFIGIILVCSIPFPYKFFPINNCLFVQLNSILNHFEINSNCCLELFKIHFIVCKCVFFFSYILKCYHSLK